MSTFNNRISRIKSVLYDLPAADPDLPHSDDPENLVAAYQHRLRTMPSRVPDPVGEARLAALSDTELQRLYNERIGES